MQGPFSQTDTVVHEQALLLNYFSCWKARVLNQQQQFDQPITCPFQLLGFYHTLIQKFHYLVSSNNLDTYLLLCKAVMHHMSRFGPDHGDSGGGSGGAKRSFEKVQGENVQGAPLGDKRQKLPALARYVPFDIVA